jgi:hypothetical protein
VIGPRADWVHLSLAPLWALGLGLAVGATPLKTRALTAFGQRGSLADGFIGTFIFAHLFLVFFRSHADPEIRARHPVRFLAVPPLLFLLFLVSPVARAAGAALAVWWDVYHSSLQTFGIGRIFDAKEGNDPEAGRTMDLLLNLLLYVGPILGGALLTYHAAAFYEFSTVGLVSFAAVPPALLAAQGRLRLLLVALGAPFLTAYAVYYAYLIGRGRRVGARKAVLYLSTGVCSIWAWGFNPLGMGLFIMNFFHAWQYFAIVWRYENKSVVRVLRVPEGPRRGLWGFAAMTAVAFAYGAAGGALGGLWDWAFCLTLTVSLLHFWYDGFVWSVRRGDA